MTLARIGLVDCSLRDGHQSLLATRMSTEQCLRVLPLLRDMEYRVLELWGGATLDAALRYTGDDPFERLGRFREVLDAAGDARAPIQIRSLCRGQNLFGYTPYPDNVVVSFLKEAVRLGNAYAADCDHLGRGHRMRVFDALNDHRNLVTAIMATKTFNGHAEAAISYTTSPIHNSEHFVAFAKAAIDAGADSLAIKDMAGLLHPADAFELIDAIRRELPHVQLSLHAHCTNGLATATYVAAMISGKVQLLDTCHGPMAGSTSQPPAELIKYFADALGLQTGLDWSRNAEIDVELRRVRQELSPFDGNPDQPGRPWPALPSDEVRRTVETAIDLLSRRDRDSCDKAISLIEDGLMVRQGYPPVDRQQLAAQVPGGMISNLRSQLKEQGRLEQLPQILEEVPRVRAAAGYVPLVTPTSQIVGTQAAINIMQGQPYAIVTEPFRELMLGRYGKLPGSPNSQVLELVSRGRHPYVGRPSDHVADVDLAALHERYLGLITSQRDLLLLVLFPQAAEAFLKQRRERAAA